MTDFHVKNSVPLLPAVDLKETVAFYKDLGFANLYEDEIRAGGYAVMDNGYFTFHLYTYKKLPIPTPTNMHLYEIENIDALYELFMAKYKAVHGKVPPRNGLPRVGIPKNLNADRRFSITDPNGNQFIFVQPFEKKDHQIKTRFEKLYWESNTLAYSHEIPTEAIEMLESAFKKTENLESESPNIVFQAFVLLMDNYALLDAKKMADFYYTKAAAWFERIDNTEDGYLQDAIEQYKSFNL